METALSGDEDALQRFVLHLPNAARGWFALGAYHSGLPNPGFRRVLADVWDHDHRALIEAVKGRRSTIRAMMRHADFDISGLPETFPVYRGTSRLPPSKAAQGLSWTTSYEVAAWFAMRPENAEWLAAQHGATVTKDRPLVLTAQANRSDIVFHHAELSEDEVVLSRDLRRDEVAVIDGPDEWARLSDTHQAAKEARRHSWLAETQTA